MFARFLIAILTCIFVLPVFADDGSGDETLECMLPENDHRCLAKNTSCNYPGTAECSAQNIPGGSCYVEYMKCEVECRYCGTFDCQTEGYPQWDNQWSSDNDNVGYEKKEQKDIDTTNMCQEIVVATQYRCAAGYYPAGDGNATTIEDLNCTACPSWYPKGDNQGPYVNAVSSAGATSVRGCSIQAGTEYGTDNKVEIQDDTGQFDVWFDSSCSHE